MESLEKRSLGTVLGDDGGLVVMGVLEMMEGPALGWG